MGISNERRYYLTLPDADYKQRLISESVDANMSTSRYIVYQLDLMRKLKGHPVGKALVENIGNGSK